MKLNQFIDHYNDEYTETLKKLDKEVIAHLYQKMKKAREAGNTIYIMGNGGSAASASHWVCDFNKGTNVDGTKRMKLVCLNDNIPIFSALGNDISYEKVFVEQLKNYLIEGNLIIGLSVSGNSQNIVSALKYAKENGGETFSIIGDYNGNMKEYCDESLIVSSKNFGIVEDVHMYICHLLSQYMLQENKQQKP